MTARPHLWTASFQWLSPCECVPPHAADPQKVYRLAQTSLGDGIWGEDEPVLIGYRLPDYLKPVELYGQGGKVQLLSGSHRYEIFRKLAEGKNHRIPVDFPRKLPVLIYPESAVKEAWGTPRWNNLMNPRFALWPGDQPATLRNTRWARLFDRNLLIWKKSEEDRRGNRNC